MGLFGGGDDAASDMRKMEAERQARISQGMGQINQIFGGFDEPFYAGRRQAYVNYAMPQFGEQARQMQNQLFFALANRGLQRGSAAGQQQSAFDVESARQKQAIIDAAFGQSQTLRQQVEGQRSSLISQLQASADPNSVAQQALASATQYSAPSVYQPLSGLFNNFANIYLANQMANMYRQQPQQGYGGGMNLGFAQPGSSQQITRRP